MSILYSHSWPEVEQRDSFQNGSWELELYIDLCVGLSQHDV